MKKREKEGVSMSYKRWQENTNAIYKLIRPLFVFNNECDKSIQNKSMIILLTNRVCRIPHAE